MDGWVNYEMVVTQTKEKIRLDTLCPKKIKKDSKTLSYQIYMKITTKIPTQGIHNKRFNLTVFHTYKDKIVI